VGRPPQGGQAPGRSGVYGAPQPPPPSGNGGRGQSQRPSGFGQGDRADMNTYRSDRHRHDDSGRDHRR
jgi:hypothetical protein